MSDTPRTDKYGGYCAEYHKVDGMTLIQHARNLELENAELLKDKERLDWVLNNYHLMLPDMERWEVDKMAHL